MNKDIERLTAAAPRMFVALDDLVHRSEHEQDGVVICLLCGEVTASKYVDAGKVHHVKDCPVTAARAVLIKAGK